MASSEPYIGSIDLWPLTWATSEYVMCNGQLLTIQQYSPLFALIGITFGGNGSTNFAVPNMQGRVPIGAGTSPVSGKLYKVGDVGGSETFSLGLTNLPAHTHTAAGTVTPKAGTGKIVLTSDPTAAFAGQTASTTPVYTTTNNVTMGESPVTITVAPAGSNAPFYSMPPYLALNYIIAVMGLFPTRP
jgi:microcystin-dependent protein